MHKHLSARVVATAIIFLIALFGISRVGADSSTPWIASPLSLTKQADTTSTPPTLGNNGNIDCSLEPTSGCSVPTGYGEATSNSSVRLNSSDSLLPVTTFIDGRQHFYPVANSTTAISYFSGPPYGLDLAFNYNFTSSAKKINGGLQLTKAPDGKLTDSANHLLAADLASISYSENGLWMVVSDPNVATLRVNLQSFQVVPFGIGFNYTIGLDPGVKTAITNNGRYAIAASKNFSTFKIYDVSTCAAVPSTINAPVVCQSRDLYSYMQQSVSGFDSIINARFMDDNTLAVYAVYKSGGINKIARFIISTNGASSQLDYLALGDSYISGEGAFDYMAGTDTDTNKCHLSFLSYPFLIGQDINYNSYHSVACSGAVTNDLTDTRSDYHGQANRGQFSRAQLDASGQTAQYLSSFLPGYLDQLDFVKTYQPKVLTVSVGGNDMGFSDILKTCAEPWNLQTCYSTYEDRLELFHRVNSVVYPRLLQTYQKLKAAGPPDMRIYVIGYPQIAKPGGDCALNVHLNADEIVLSQQLIDYLDTVIKTAATNTGVYYVDTQDALFGHRLCEAGPGSVAMNGLTAGNDKPTKLGGPLADESYHPNPTGYMLLENKILAATHNLINPMPASDSSVQLPAENGLEILDAPHIGRSVNSTEFDPGMADDLIYTQTPTPISIEGATHDLAAATTLNAELHSTPIKLGSFTTDSVGDLNTQITIPAGTPYGYHTLHFYGNDLNGQLIDIYKAIYVAATVDDIDGNGINDSTQACVGVNSSGIDTDKDGIDDGCDANITQPPPIDTQPTNNNTSRTSSTDNSTDVSSPDIQLAAQNNLESSAAETPTLPSGIDTSAIITTNQAIVKQPTQVLGASTEAGSPSRPNPAKREKSLLLSVGSFALLASACGLLARRFKT